MVVLTWELRRAVVSVRSGTGRESGKIIALDVLSMEAIPGVTVIQGDFRKNPFWSS